jgi:histidinol-phosphate aminotransferase
MTRLVTESIETLRPYSAGKPLEELARERGVSDAVKLASNENPLPPSPAVLDAIARAARSVHRYPDARVHELRHAVAVHLGVSPDELVFGNGSNELIELVVRTFSTPVDHIVFAEPSFVVYRMAAVAHGVMTTAVPLRERRHDLAGLLGAVTDSTAIVFIANPNNPTGTYVSRTELADFLSRLPERVIAVIDEAYFEYASADDYPDALKLRDLHERLIVLRTFSKAYGLAGLRLGYAVGPRQLCDYLDRVRAPFNANSLAQAAAVAALRDQAHLAACTQQNEQQRELLMSRLQDLGVRVVPSQANFVLVELGRKAEPLFEALLDHGVITRLIPPLPEALRVSIGTPAENARLLTALEEVLR